MGTLSAEKAGREASSASCGRTLDGNSRDSGVSKRHRFSSYTGSMARGWESKSVEAQQEEAVATDGKKRGQLSPEQLAEKRKRDELTLMRKKVEHDLAVAENPRHRQMLEQALADLDSKLGKLPES